MPLFMYFLVERMAGASLFHKSKESLLLQGNSFIHGLFIHQIDMWTYYVPGAMLGMTNIPTWRNFSKKLKLHSLLYTMSHLIL